MPDELKILAMEVSEILINNESAENPINWKIILESFDFDYLLDAYPRLINSQYFGDEVMVIM